MTLFVLMLLPLLFAFTALAVKNQSREMHSDCPLNDTYFENDPAFETLLIKLAASESSSTDSESSKKRQRTESMTLPAAKKPHTLGGTDHARSEDFVDLDMLNVYKDFQKDADPIDGVIFLEIKIFLTKRFKEFWSHIQNGNSLPSDIYSRMKQAILNEYRAQKENVIMASIAEYAADNLRMAKANPEGKELIELYLRALGSMLIYSNQPTSDVLYVSHTYIYQLFGICSMAADYREQKLSQFYSLLPKMSSQIDPFSIFNSIKRLFIQKAIEYGLTERGVMYYRYYLYLLRFLNIPKNEEINSTAHYYSRVFNILRVKPETGYYPVGILSTTPGYSFTIRRFISKDSESSKFLVSLWTAPTKNYFAYVMRHQTAIPKIAKTYQLIRILGGYYLFLAK